MPSYSTFVLSWDLRHNHCKGQGQVEETKLATDKLANKTRRYYQPVDWLPTLITAAHSTCLGKQQLHKLILPLGKTVEESAEMCWLKRHDTDRWPFCGQIGTASQQLWKIKAVAWGEKKWLSSLPSLPTARCIQTQPEGKWAIEKWWNK